MKPFNAFALLELSEVLLDILMEHDFKQKMMSGKITPAQGRIFSALAERHPEGLMLKELARELHLTPGAVSQSVERLVADGSVTREVSSSDRRAVSVRITQKGLQFKQNNDRRLGDILSTLMQDIPEEEKQIFQKVAAHVLREGKKLRDSAMHENTPQENKIDH